MCECPRKNIIAGWCNGNTAGFEPVYLGSNPSPAATHHSVHGFAVQRMEVRDVPNGTSPQNDEILLHLCFKEQKKRIYLRWVHK